MTSNEIVTKAQEELKSIDKPKFIDRESYEYKLAKYYFALFKAEEADHQITKQEFVRSEGVLKQYSNVYNGMDRERLGIKELADQRIASDYAAATEMDNVFKPKKAWNFKVTMWVAILALGLVFMWQYGSNASFKAGVDKNSFVIAIIAIAGVAVALYLTMKKKK